jgi:hypothetical protein
MPSPPPDNAATWDIGCRELYDYYLSWARTTPFRLCSPLEFYEVLKSVYPSVEIIDLPRPPYRFFDKVRRSYPPTDKDFERERLERLRTAAFERKFGRSTDEGGSDGG